MIVVSAVRTDLGTRYATRWCTGGIPRRGSDPAHADL